MTRAHMGLLAIGLFLTGVHAQELPTPAPIDPKASADSVAEHVCAQCHGPAGMATLANVPNLAGQHAEYLAKQLREFRSRHRADANAAKNMWGVAHNLTDKQIDGLAAHFAAQKPQAQPTEGKPGQIAAGKPIFTGGAMAQGVPACSGCHGEDGVGKTMFPRLAGQHMTYLIKQLMVFQRTNERPGGAVMKSVSHELTPENIENVAAYLQALPAAQMH